MKNHKNPSTKVTPVKTPRGKQVPVNTGVKAGDDGSFNHGTCGPLGC